MKQKRILVVDDDLVTREVVSRVIRSEGFLPMTCENGPKGVHEALATKPDLMILDLMMPSPDPQLCPVFDGMSVLEWLASLPEEKRIPVVVLSAKSETENRPETLKAGAMDYVQKPFDRARLIAAVKKGLARRKPEGAETNAPEAGLKKGLDGIEELILCLPPQNPNWRTGMTESHRLPSQTGNTSMTKRWAVGKAEM